MPRPRELQLPARGGGAGEPQTLTASPLAPSSYSHALDGMYRVLREGEAVPAGVGEPAWGVLADTGKLWQERPGELCRGAAAGAHPAGAGRGDEAGPWGPWGQGS